MKNRPTVRLTGLLILGSVALLAVPRVLRAQGLVVTGYGDVEWTYADGGDEGWHNAFDNHHLNLIFLGAITDDLLVGAEVEYEHAGDEIGLEYAYLGYTGFKNVRLMAGKFLLPFNKFNKDLHPTWISRMPGRPLVYNQVFPVGYSDVGLWASGAFPVSGGSRVVWDGYLVNGLEGEADATNFRELREYDHEDPGVNRKAFGGRLGVELAQGLGAGVSGYSGAYANDEDTGEALGITFLGADVSYGKGNLDLRGEFVAASQELTTTSDNNNRKGFYAQAAYMLNQFEPVVRFSWVDFEEDANDTSELGLGINYYVGPSSAIRFAYFINTERHDEFKTDNNKLVGQFVIAF